MSYFLDPVAVTNFPSVVQFFANNTLFWLNKHSWHPLQHHTCTSIRNLLLHMPSHASRISQLADIAFKQSMTILLPCVSRWDWDKYSSVKSCSSTKNGTTSSATIKLYLLVSHPAPEASPTCSTLPKRAISATAVWESTRTSESSLNDFFNSSGLNASALAFMISLALFTAQPAWYLIASSSEQCGLLW